MEVSFKHLHTEKDEGLFEKFIQRSEEFDENFRNSKFCKDIRNRVFEKSERFPVDILMCLDEEGNLLGHLVYYLFPIGGNVYLQQASFEDAVTPEIAKLMFIEFKNYVTNTMTHPNQCLNYIFTMLEAPLMENATMNILDFLIMLELKPYKVNIRPERCIPRTSVSKLASVDSLEKEQPKWLINIMNPSKYLSPHLLKNFIYDWCTLEHDLDENFEDIDKTIDRELTRYKTHFPVHDIENSGNDLLTNAEILFTQFDYELLKNIDRDAFIERFFEKPSVSVIIHFLDDGNVLKFSETYTEIHKIIDILQALYDKTKDMLDLHNEKIPFMYKSNILQIWIDGNNLILPTQIT